MGDSLNFISKYKVASSFQGDYSSLLDNFETGPGINPAFRKKEWLSILEENKILLREEQSKLYAESKQGVLILFQSMDGGGKDSAIKHVIGLNPQGVRVNSFKQPSKQEALHDFLWRYAKAVPERGMIGIFNRSYYEEVLVVKVHELYKKTQLKGQLQSEEVFLRRYQHIVNFENYLTDNGITIIKIFLNLGSDEQRNRFIKRIDRSDKNWKFSDADMNERGFWSKYREAFATAIALTSTEQNPWWVIPADNKKYARALISTIIVETISGLQAEYPKTSHYHTKKLAVLREKLVKCEI